MTRILFSLLISFYCLSCATDTKESEFINNSGVSLDLAMYRNEQVHDVIYILSFVVPEEKELPIAGNLTLNVTVNDLSRPLYLDFKEGSSAVKKVLVNAENTAIVHTNEHITIPKETLRLGPNSIEIEFKAGDLSINRNSDYLYTLLVPDRARTLFPCFDQPNIKAKYILNITAPENWQVLCGAPVKSRVVNGGTATYQFEKSDSMSTYLFSFVAGAFKKTTSKKTAQTMTMLYRETDEEKISMSTSAIFEAHQSSLDFLEAYTQYPFPFKKFDMATIPGFQYGGMEHTGAIQYRESVLFLDESATRSQELSRAKLIAHETAHMWFGNLVTMKWFNDVWMKEVFANFMADKIVNPVFSDINHDLQFLTSHYPRAYNVDRTRGANAIRQDLENLNNAGALYGGIIYNKAPIMMRQLELALGNISFKKGIQAYIENYANGNADWNELISILDKESEIDLNMWSDIWVNSTGRPLFSAHIKYDETNKIEQFVLHQKAEDGSDKFWPQSFDVSLVYTDEIVVVPVKSDTNSVELSEAVGHSKPLSIIYNSNGYGYGLFPTTDTDMAQTATIIDEVARAHTYLNNYENMLNGTLDKSAVFENLCSGLQTESNELVLKMISNQLTSLFWNSFTQNQRLTYVCELEKLLYKRLRKAVSKDIKKSLFETYATVAFSESGISNLYGIWLKEETIENLVLNQDDYTKLAAQLAVFGHSNANEILEEAHKNLTNADKIARLDFLLPALDSDPMVRTDYFKSFKDAKSREKENWLLEACAYIHHPLRQNEGIKTVGMSLELLEEIQGTGDIFFPLGWLKSTIGKYSSKEAYCLVDAYLAEHPTLDESLRKKLLQATDNLYRRQKSID